VLAEQGGNKSRCARVLGLHRATLHAKLKTYRIAL
jgi:DNA-binding protein Fis